ncbi:MAG: hypothetical protein N3B01_07495 [Verrucomicrobiae bacterium]|nr:hypothetical protein [Verrucomicrobiae bacterium]
MIVPMKKVTLLCVAHSREEALERLRDLGVVHLQPVSQRECEDVETARRRYEYVRHALDVLPKHSGATPTHRPPEEIVETVWKFIHELRELDSQQTALTHELERYAPFGDFEPADIQALRERGIFIRLYQAPAKSPPAVPHGAALVPLHQGKTALHFAVVSLAPVEIPNAQEIPLPSQPPAATRQRLRAIAERRHTIQQQMEVFAADRPRVATLLADAEDRWRFAEARAGMGLAAAEAIAYLQGFCPAEDAELLRKAAAANGWGLVVADPGPDDRVPTLLRHPRWVRPIRPVLQMIGILPGYREVDISAAFLVFLSLFFAILVGDAGYGALFLAGGIWAQRRFPKPPPELFALIRIVSVVTIAWGVLTGVYFGCKPPLLQRLALPWLQNPENVKWLAFTVGAVHLSLAHLWNIARNWRSSDGFAQHGQCILWR